MFEELSLAPYLSQIIVLLERKQTHKSRYKESNTTPNVKSFDKCNGPDQMYEASNHSFINPQFNATAQMLYSYKWLVESFFDGHFKFLN